MKICRTENKREVVDIKFEVCGSGYCCKKMEEWLRIGIYHDRQSMLYDTNKGKFELRVRNSSDCYSDNDNCSAYEDLNFCPFCGERLQKTAQKPKVECQCKSCKSKKRCFGRKKKGNN